MNYAFIPSPADPFAVLAWLVGLALMLWVWPLAWRGRHKQGGYYRGSGFTDLMLMCMWTLACTLGLLLSAGNFIISRWFA